MKKLKYRIHFELQGEHTWFEVEADTIEEIKELAEKGVHRRNGINPYSELVED